MNHNEIKAGDLVQVTAVIKADTVVRSGDGKTTIRFVNSSGRSAQVRLDDNDLVTLIERPLPPLPTEIGSVIEVTNTNPFDDDHQTVTRWFLRESRAYSQGMWQGTTHNAARGFDEMQKFVELHGNFKVLL